MDVSLERTHHHTDAVNRLRDIFNDENITSVRSRLHEEGFTIRQEEDATYAINFKQHIIINLSEKNLNLERLKKPMNQPMKIIKQQKQLQTQKYSSHFSSKAKLHDTIGGSHSENREWEVGLKDNSDDTNDILSIKR